ncbi:hypothetical protein [Enterovirga sp.]|jgi:hypothetical protein|uniref:hypothetical protein n=1 Tax=Enterovirga sp. TaxID=2026350 RepID=UPI0026216249|nr:hypothetical protein [Enterovirga sp.]MDB5592548.1 hypothetical protein [Enterovirga sp.]
MVNADEFSRSLRGLSDLLNRRAEGLAQFELSLPAFWRSFAAVLLTAPAYVVELALVRRNVEGAAVGLFDDPGLALLVGAGHVLAFLALPVAMIFVARRLGLGHRYVPFVIVTNWLQVFASLALAVPGALLVLGWETPALTALFTLAFTTIVLHVQWFATRVTLQVGALAAALVTALGLALSVGSTALVQALA